LLDSTFKLLKVYTLKEYRAEHILVCSVPDRRCGILKVVLVRRLVTWVLGIWRGEGVGNGLRKGRSVYKQPETEVDGSCHSKEGSK
jgi:hypothetical protein